MYGLDEIQTAKGMHFSHIKTRSITNKWEVFKTQFSSSNLHILGISETRLNEKLPSEMFSLSNEYCPYRNNRNWVEAGSQTIKNGAGSGHSCEK